MSPMHIGHRHILPIYPFLFIFASQIILIHKKIIKTGVALLLFWYIAGGIKIHPHYLAYFNELAEGPNNGYKYLVDSNMDWGQDLKGLKEYVQKNNISDVVLSYYGGCLSDYINFDFQDLFSFGIVNKKEYINSLNPKKEILAISATNLQGVYLGKVGHDIFYWLKNKKPADKIGYSIFVYDITNDAYIHKRLAHAYFVTTQYEKAIREAKRTIILGKSHRFCNFLMSLIYTYTNQELLAIQYYKKATQFENRKEILDNIKRLITNSLAQNAYSDSLSRLSFIFLRKELWKEAEQINHLNLMIRPDNIYPYIHLGVIYEKNRLYDKALQFLLKAEQIDFTLPEIHYNKAVCYYKKRNYNKALENVKKALSFDSKHLEAKFLLNLISQKLKIN